MTGRALRVMCFLAVLAVTAGMAVPFALSGQAEGSAEDITRKCTIRVSEGDRDRLIDGSVRSNWTYSHPGAYVGVKMPEGVQAGWLRVEWFMEPAGFELIEFSADQTPLRTRTQQDTFPSIYGVFDLLAETKYVELKMTAEDQRVGTLAVYSAGALPRDVQQWQPPVDKADLMVVSTHQDDELIFLGGTIPYYATALQKPTVVLYMANCGRYRREEALNALWKMGVRNYPVFLNLKDDKVGSLNEGIKVWGGRDNILSLLVGRIRRFKPEVIVTQDLNGEYGHNQHKITARAMKYAIDAAADPQQYPDSAELYGAWQVKKLYHHLYKENRIVMDWEKPLESLNGYTALQVAQIGMQEHASQLKYYAVKSHGTYDNSKFGLYFTTVGEDVQKDDFLENIDPQASRIYLEEHADEIARWKEREAQLALAPTSPPSQQTEPDPEAESPEADAPEGSEALSESASAPETGEDAPAASEEAPLPAEADSTPLPGKQTSVGNGSAGRDGAAVLPLIMIGAGMAAVGLGAWYGFSVLRPGHRRRRGHRSGR